MKPQRTVTHYACTPETTGGKGYLSAVCDDGTVWVMILGANVRWERVPSIPGTQPEPKV